MHDMNQDVSLHFKMGHAIPNPRGFKHHYFKQRQAEGIAAAKAKGVKFGRPEKPLPDNFSEYCQMCRDGKIFVLKASKECGMPESTFRQKMKKALETDEQ